MSTDIISRCGNYVYSCFISAGDIHTACKNGEKRTVANLLKQGTDVNERDENGWLPIHWATQAGHLSLVKYLVENGSFINQLTDSMMVSPLLLACEKRHYEIAEFLLENGAEPNGKEMENLTPILHYIVATHADEKIVKLLIEKGALLGDRDALGRTPLHVVKSLAMRTLLSKAGAAVGLKDNEGLTPSQLALKTSNYLIAAAQTEGHYPAWIEASVHERNTDGQLDKSIEHTYLYDNLTSDLYFEDSDLQLRIKSIAVAAFALPYAIFASYLNLAQIISDAASIIWKRIANFADEPLDISLKSFVISIVRDIPKAVIYRIYLAAASPLLGIALIFAGLYGLYDPLEGRKLMNTIEGYWDQKYFLWIARMQKVGNVAESGVNGYAKFYMNQTGLTEEERLKQAAGKTSFVVGPILGAMIGGAMFTGFNALGIGDAVKDAANGSFTATFIHTFKSPYLITLISAVSANAVSRLSVQYFTNMKSFPAAALGGAIGTLAGTIIAVTLERGYNYYKQKRVV